MVMARPGAAAASRAAARSSIVGTSLSLRSTVPRAAERAKRQPHPDREAAGPTRSLPTPLPDSDEVTSSLSLPATRRRSSGGTSSSGSPQENSGHRSSVEAHRIKVAVRCRPLNAQEKKLGSKNIWQTRESFVEELADSGEAPAGKSYAYDFVFGCEATNMEVYEKQCKDIIEGALDGYNGTIFAYGQTSSGKTHTLMGDYKNNPGIAPLAIGDVFNYIAAHPETEWEVFAAYLEIYNEQITDLLQKDLSKASNLKITEDKVFGPGVKDLTEIRALSVQHCLDMLLEGERTRHYGSTQMNAKSSRSHTLFRLRIGSKAVSGGQQDETLNSMRTVASELMSTAQQISASKASLYLVDREHAELYIHSGDITLRMPLSQGIAGAVATSGESVNIADAYKDSRFNPDVDKKTGFTTRSILCMPIAFEGVVIGVVQYINKDSELDGSSPLAFEEEDVEAVAVLTKRIGPLVRQAQLNTRTTMQSRLNLVDLAGSERLSKTGSTGVTLKEAAHINTSLSSLSHCIALLSEERMQHIPFRNSKLTHLLSTSLGGNTNTSIICNFSPATRNRHETISTFQFASRAKKIVNSVKKNLWRDQTELVQCYAAEIERLQEQLRQYSGGGRPSQGGPQHFSIRGERLETDVDVVLTAECTARLGRLEVDAARLEALSNAHAPSTAARLRLRVLVAVSPCEPALGDPELVVKATGGPRSEEESQAWFSESELRRHLAKVCAHLATAPRPEPSAWPVNSLQAPSATPPAGSVSLASAEGRGHGVGAGAPAYATAQRATALLHGSTGSSEATSEEQQPRQRGLRGSTGSTGAGNNAERAYSGLGSSFGGSGSAQVSVVNPVSCLTTTASSPCVEDVRAIISDLVAEIRNQRDRNDPDILGSVTRLLNEFGNMKAELATTRAELQVALAQKFTSVRRPAEWLSEDEPMRQAITRVRLPGGPGPGPPASPAAPWRPAVALPSGPPATLTSAASRARARSLSPVRAATPQASSPAAPAPGTAMGPARVVGLRIYEPMQCASPKVPMMAPQHGHAHGPNGHTLLAAAGPATVAARPQSYSGSAGSVHLKVFEGPMLTSHAPLHSTPARLPQAGRFDSPSRGGLQAPEKPQGVVWERTNRPP